MASPKAPPNSSQPTTAEVVGGVYNATTPTLVDGQASALQLDSSGNLKTTSSGGGGGGNVNITGVNGPAPALSNPLPVELSDGTNAVGTVGNPLSVNVISGGGSNASVGTTGTPAPASATQVGGSDGTNLQSLQVDGSKNLKIVVNAALPAGTNVIGHVINDASSAVIGHVVTDTGSTTAVTALPAIPAGSNNIGGVELIDSAGTNKASISAAGAVKVDGSAVTQPVSGSVTATQATGTNLHVVVDSAPTTAVTLPAGQAVELLDSGGTNKASISAAGALKIDGSAVTQPISGTVTDNQGTAAANTAGWPVTAGGIAESTAAWTSATGGNTALTLTVTGYSTVVVTLNQTTTITSGAVTFETSDTAGFTNAYQAFGNRVANGGNGVYTNFPNSTFALQANTNTAFIINVAGWAAFRVRLSTVISGSGTVNVGVSASSVATSATYGQAIVVNSTTTKASTTIADNIANVNILAGTDAGNAPLIIAGSFYGGAFSGTADATRQGWSKARTPTVFKTASVSAATTGNSAIWTPSSGNKFRLLGFQITAQGLAATASAAITVSFQDSASGMPLGTYDVDIPAAANVSTGVSQISGGAINVGYFGILSAAANNVLNFNISAAGAGTVGTYRVTVWGTEE